jgi:endo-1,4-beta-xylanase
MSDSWSRRRFLGSAAVLPFAASAGAARVPAAAAALPQARCTILDADGAPVPASELERFYVCDLLSRPIPIEPQMTAGSVVFEPPSQPFRIGVPLNVPGFGRPFVYADNRGEGHTARSLGGPTPIFLDNEFAADRLATVRRLQDECREEGLSVSPAASARADEAERLLKAAQALAGNPAAAARPAMESLRESLWAGEMIVVERARQRIAHRGPRPGFLFGCNAFGYNDYGKPFAERFEALFDYATLPFYHSGVEKVRGQRDYSRVDSLLSWLGTTRILPKGHPLIFPIGGVMPAWLRNRPFDETRRGCLDYVFGTVSRYRHRIHVWDVVNELHVQPEVGTGYTGFTCEENVELTRQALETARKADPTCYRIVNSTGTWGDYYLGRKPAVWQQSVYDYLSRLQDARCDYEAIGLQYYHSGRDMLEFERDLERFEGFGKPIQISELEFPSSSEDVPDAEWWGGGKGGARMAWHGDSFTEETQADWLEQVYTIAFSKPYVVALTWWDLSDPAFMPHGGLVREDMTPKKSYERLAALRRQWHGSEPPSAA